MYKLEGEIRYNFFSKKIEIPFETSKPKVFKITTKCFSNDLKVLSDTDPVQFFKFENTNFRKRIYRLYTTFENEGVIIEYNHKRASIKSKIRNFEFEIIRHDYMKFTFLESFHPFGILDRASSNLIIYKYNYRLIKEFDKKIISQLILYTYICCSVLNNLKLEAAYGDGTTTFTNLEPIRRSIF